MPTTPSHNAVEIDLYEELVQFHLLSPEERLAAMQSLVASPEPAPFEEPLWASPPSASSTEMGLNGLTEESRKAQEVIGTDEIDFAENVANDFAITEEPQASAPVAELTVVEPVVEIEGVEPVAEVAVVEPVKAMVEAIKTPPRLPEPTVKPAPVTETVSKTGVRISVRQVETHGSVTLNVDDIPAEDDWQPDAKPNAKPDAKLAEAPARSEPNTPVVSPQEIPAVLSATDAVKIETPIPGQQKMANPSAAVAPPAALPRVTNETPKATPAVEAANPKVTKSESTETQRDSKPLRVTGFLAEYLAGELKENANAVACPTCGHESDEQDLICIQCGGFLEVEEPPASVQALCEDCGEAVEVDEVFCPECGAILRID